MLRNLACQDYKSGIERHGESTTTTNVILSSFEILKK